MITSRDGILIPTTFADLCTPARMALVVYDMQVGVCSQIKGAETIIGQVGAALEAARSAGMRVAFTRHFSLPRRWMGMTQRRTAMAWQRQADPDAVEPWFQIGRAHV